MDGNVERKQLDNPTNQVAFPEEHSTIHLLETTHRWSMDGNVERK
jgi:hypothetical protein